MLSYFLIGADGQETLPKLGAIELAHHAVHWFGDMESVGLIGALERPGFGELHQFARKGDILVVPSLDCLGASAAELIEIFQAFREKGVAVVSMREGFDPSSDIGKAMLTMLAAVAELERSNIKARQMAGIARARATGQKLGAPKKIDDLAVSAWRKAQKATIQETAHQFGISIAEVKRACANKSFNIEAGA
ncbi:recombinase family protein [Pseudomonas sp. DWP3-1-2]|uniref:recombinase family protein n=1 Tax=Pseudomonas sp. DWP3-1-2 TaxID=2804645 RepID=UPI003CF77092